MAWFQLYYKIIVITAIWYWHKNKYIDQGNRNKPTLIWSVYDKGGKNMRWGKDNLFSKQCWENWTATHDSMKLNQFITPSTRARQANIYLWDHIKFKKKKNSCTGKEIIHKMERNWMGENIFKWYFIRGLYPKYINNSYISISINKESVLKIGRETE